MKMNSFWLTLYILSLSITSFMLRECLGVWLNHGNSLTWLMQAEFCPFSNFGLAYGLWSLYWLLPELYTVVIYIG